jgi:hypothetical protein
MRSASKLNEVASGLIPMLKMVGYDSKFDLIKTAMGLNPSLLNDIFI